MDDIEESGENSFTQQKSALEAVNKSIYTVLLIMEINVHKL